MTSAPSATGFGLGSDGTWETEVSLHTPERGVVRSVLVHLPGLRPAPGVLRLPFLLRPGLYPRHRSVGEGGPARDRGGSQEKPFGGRQVGRGRGFGQSYLNASKGGDRPVPSCDTPRPEPKGCRPLPPLGTLKWVRLWVRPRRLGKDAWVREKFGEGVYDSRRIRSPLSPRLPFPLRFDSG